MRILTHLEQKLVDYALLTQFGQPYICQRTKESVFQNHRKQAKINVAFHHFPLLGLNETP